MGGIGHEHVPEGIDQNSSFAFLGLYARSLVRACPKLAKVKVLRQWAGCYDLTPDQNPIVGAVDDVEGSNTSSTRTCLFPGSTSGATRSREKSCCAASTPSAGNRDATLKVVKIPSGEQRGQQ